LLQPAAMRPCARVLTLALLLLAPAIADAQYNYHEIVWTSRGHGVNVSAVRYSPDGRYLATGGSAYSANGGSVVIWAAATGAKLSEVTRVGDNDLAGPKGIDFFPEGNRLITAEGNLQGSGGSAARTPGTHGVESDSAYAYPSREITVPGGVPSALRAVDGYSLRDVDVSPDGTLIAYAQDLDRTVEVHDAVTREKLYELPLPGDGSGAVKFSPDSQFLAAGDKNGVVRIFRLNDRSVLADLQNRDSVGTSNWFAMSINTLAWTADGKRLAVAVGGYGCGVRIWNVEQRTLIHSLRLNYQIQPVIDFTPDEKYLVVGSTEWDYKSEFNVIYPVNVRFIDPVAGTVVAMYNVPLPYPGDALQDLDVSPDGRHYAYGTSSGNVAVARNPFFEEGEQEPDRKPRLDATMISSSEVRLTWTAVDGAETYEIVRKAPGGDFVTLAIVSGTSASDFTVKANDTYLYKVRALSSAWSDAPYSNVAVATTVTFTSNPLLPNVDYFRREHLEEVRTCVAALRQAGGLGSPVFTDPALSGDMMIKALHLREVRDQMDEARAALGIPPVLLTEVLLEGGSTAIKAAHVQDLRGGCD
jgi:WD40 repeat protein